MSNNKATEMMRSVTAFGTSFIRATNAPNVYGDRQKQYMRGRVADMVKNRTYLASDFVSALCQGLADDFYDFSAVNVRLSDITSKTASATRKSDDYKHILIADPSVSYIPPGAKIKAMGSMWLCVNPANISSAHPTAVIARCNASYNSFDEYGNVISEPIVIERLSMFGNTSKNPDNLVLMDGYFNVIAQKNSNTERLGENKRIILGNRAYHITGFSDFMEEFSGDRDSVHLLTFTIRVEEPTEYDDMDLRIAEGKTFVFDSFIDGPNLLTVGDCRAFSAYFTVNGSIMNRYSDMVDLVSLDVDPKTGILTATYPKGYRGTEFSLSDNMLIASTPDHLISPDLFLEDGEVIVSLRAVDQELPVSFLWSSDNPSVAVVDENGAVTAVGTGNTVIRATLAQNPAISASASLSVTESSSEPYVEFIGGIAPCVMQFSTVTLSASMFRDGAAVNMPLRWQFSGVDEKKYSASVSTDGRSCSITCLLPDGNPLLVTCECEGVSASVSLVLEGY